MVPRKVVFNVGDSVAKVTGYRFIGVVVAAFTKRDGASVRYIVENDDGLLHIFNADQLELKRPEPEELCGWTSWRAKSHS